MAKSRKNKKVKTQQKQSPAKYIAQRANNFDFYECYINNGWEEGGMASILISKQMPSGNYIVGIYMVDVYCLGLKKTDFRFNLDEFDYKEFVEKIYSGDFLLRETAFVHNLIYGAIDYAEDLGFLPHKDFIITEHLLDSDLITDEINDIEFGKDGKPFYISGPFDNSASIMATLTKSVGKSGFEYISEVTDDM